MITEKTGHVHKFALKQTADFQIIKPVLCIKQKRVMIKLLNNKNREVTHNEIK